MLRAHAARKLLQWRICLCCGAAGKPVVHVNRSGNKRSKDQVADGAAIRSADPNVRKSSQSPRTGAIINQHGFNLLWIGAFTTVGAFFIWRASVTGIIFTAIVGGLTDVGYFVFIDLGGLRGKDVIES